jgi:hypothetical protein
MHSRILMVTSIATLGVTVVCWPNTASTAEWFEGQEILVECPIWHWEASPLSGVVYELCFDDVDQCVAAEIGDSVCIPGLGVHDVWVTAIDNQGASPVYYDGEVASISRVRSADFDGGGAVGISDLFMFLDKMGVTGENGEDLDGSGMVELADVMLFLDAFGKCVSEAGHLYEAC